MPIKIVDASKLLAWGGLSLIAAKRAIEKVMETGEHVLEVPKVPDVRDFVASLRQTGLAVTPRPRRSAKEIMAVLVRLRKHLRLSQEQFALRYGFDIDALQNWEQGRREPSAFVYGYLRSIERDPAAASRDLEDE